MSLLIIFLPKKQRGLPPSVFSFTEEENLNMNNKKENVSVFLSQLVQRYPTAKQVALEFIVLRRTLGSDITKRLYCSVKGITRPTLDRYLKAHEEEIQKEYCTIMNAENEERERTK